jgi:hypothetical protein
MGILDAQRYMRWKDALDYNNKYLEENIREGRKVNTGYQEYLKANPYKTKKNELKKQKQKLIDRIIELTKQGYDKYDGK